MGRHAKGSAYTAKHANLLWTGRRVILPSGHKGIVLAKTGRSTYAVWLNGGGLLGEVKMSSLRIFPNDKRGQHLQHPTRPKWTRLYVGRRHPLADKSGFSYLHRLKAVAILGRPLRRRERADSVKLMHTHGSDETDRNSHGSGRAAGDSWLKVSNVGAGWLPGGAHD
jgi:hypothetical protein